jgi:hypothetical protein
LKNILKLLAYFSNITEKKKQKKMLSTRPDADYVAPGKNNPQK